MTKVLFDGFILNYQRQMAEIVGEIIKEKFIGGESSLAQVDLLPPPKIERLDLFFYEGLADNLIWIYTSDDFGIVKLHLIFKDETGNLIERGDAIPWPDEPNRWAYVTTGSVPHGTAVTVYAAATDGFGGMGARSERITICE
jgi:hypothetical protein